MLRGIRVAAIILALLTLVATGAAGQETASPANEGGLAQLASCGHLLVLGLIDESGSLQETDPDNKRVGGLRTALTTLATSGSRAGETNGITIEVLLAAFASDYTAPSEWTLLNSDTLPALQQRADNFAARNQGIDTDFVAALQGAQDTLGRKAAEVTAAGAPRPCQALLLFTDGGFDLDPRLGHDGKPLRGKTEPYAPDLPLDVAGNEEKVEEIGRNLICGPNGLADQLRASRTTIIAIALKPKPEDLAFLEGIGRTHASDGSNCGKRENPAGDYIPVDDRGRLLDAFQCVGGKAAGGTCVSPPPPVPPCLGTACPEGRLEFQLDPSLREFSLLVNLGAPTVVAEVAAPGAATSLELQANQAATAMLGSATLSAVPVSPLDLVIDGELPAGTDDWVGKWTVTFIDRRGQSPGAVARSQIILFGGLTPVVDPLPTFEAGEPSVFEIRVVNQEGSPRTPEDFVRSVQVSALVADPVTGARQTLDVVPAGAGRYDTEYLVPAGTTASFLDLMLTLDVTTQGGVRLQPRQQVYQVPVRQPASYPTLSPPQLRLQSIVDEGQATGTLSITGGQGDGGCAWFPGAEVKSAPDDTGKVQVTFYPRAVDRVSCIEVSAGQRRTVEVTATVEAVRRGTVEGLIQASVISGADDSTREVVVPFSFEMVKNPDPFRFWLFVLILLAGLFLPLTALWLLNTYLTVLLGLPRTRVARADVRVTRLRAVQTPLGEPLALDHEQFRAVAAGRDRCRRFKADGLAFKVRVPFWPVRPPYVQVSRSGQDVIASGVPRRSRWRSSSSRIGDLPLDLRGTWVFAIDRIDDQAISGKLFLFVSDNNVDQDAQSMLNDIRRDLPTAAWNVSEDDTPFRWRQLLRRLAEKNTKK